LGSMWKFTNSLAWAAVWGAVPPVRRQRCGPTTAFWTPHCGGKNCCPLPLLENAPPRGRMYCAVVHPHLELKTAAMREMLHTHISLHQAVEQWGNIAGLILGLMQEDYDLIRRSLKDVIVEPIRGQVIPGFLEAKNAALEAGALGSGISGSGPSLFALAPSHEIAEQCGNAMLAVYRKMGLEADVYVSNINPDGPQNGPGSRCVRLQHQSGWRHHSGGAVR